jgi:hypothetical protein
MNLNLNLDAIRGWHLQAACKDDPDPDDWFARIGTHAASRAIAVCGTCPVKQQCLAEGARNTHGVWGGSKATGRLPKWEPVETPVVEERTREIRSHGHAGYRAGCRCTTCTSVHAEAARARRARGRAAG